MTNEDAQRAAVHAEWRNRSGAWEKWADKLAELAQRFNEPLLDAAGVTAGMRALDLASGVGEPAMTAAARVGPGGHIVATDLVPEMLAAAHRRALAAERDNMTFEVCGMEDLPFADSEFDAATCRFGVMFVPEPDKALTGLRRVLKPGARAAFLVWGPLTDNTMFDILERVVREQTERSMHDLEFSPFRFGEAGSLAGHLLAAGFSDVEETSLRFAPRIQTGFPFWAANLEMSFGEALEAMDTKEKKDLDAAILAAFETVRADDVYVLDSHVRLVSGTA